MKRLILAVAAVAALVLAGCSSMGENAVVTTPDGMCAYTVGNGNMQGGNRTLNKVIYPASSDRYNSGYDMIRYFPCKGRNYAISPSSEDKGGNILMEGRTADGIPVYVIGTSYWQPNFSDEGMKAFLVLCQKYSCASDNLGVGDSNSSSAEWQNMLFENMHPVMQRAAENALPKLTADAWKRNDPDQRKLLAELMSNDFADQTMKLTGDVVSIWCGSGSTGQGATFDCQNMRVVIDAIVPKDGELLAVQATQQKEQQKLDDQRALATQRIEQTNSLYGPVLGAQVRACQDLGPSCKLVLGSGAMVQVPA